jgi:hypothetical protein
MKKTFIFIFIASICFGQNDSILSFHYKLFLNKNNNDSILIELGKYHYNNDLEIKKSIIYLSLANDSNLNNTLKLKKYELLTKCSFANNEYFNTLQYSNRALKVDSLYFDAYFYRLLAHFEQRDFESLNIELSIIAEKFDINILVVDSLKKLLNVFEKTKIYDVKYAETLSQYYPGLGQFYIGDYLNGSISFLLNTGFIAMLAHNIIQESYLDIFLISGFLEPRYYFGASKSALELAKSKNKKLLDSEKKIFYSYLLNNSILLKKE